MISILSIEFQKQISKHDLLTSGSDLKVVSNLLIYVWRGIQVYCEKSVQL